MNYNNFSCRLAVPRLVVAVPAEMAPKSSPKKGRKSSRRRLVSAATAVLLLFIGVAGMASTASAMDSADVSLRFVPAADTVAFTGTTGRLSLEVPLEPTSDESDLSAQLDAFTAQVNALTAKSFQTLQPARAVQLSVLTGVLLGLGLSVAVVRAGLLFRSDLMC